MSEIIQNEINFIKEKFQNYYKSTFVSNVVDVPHREFGTGIYGKKIYQRHLAFPSLIDLNNFLRKEGPFYISYSVSYFKYPDRRPMEKKEWFGADLCYEFDADDFDLPCKNEHDVWVCKNPECGSHGYGHLNVCPNCGGQIEIFEYVCNECLGKAKKETIRLIDVLENEFSLDPKTFIISFSGSKGYHVRITDEKIKFLTKSTRLQLMSYLLGNDINLEKLGFYLDKKQWYCPPFSSKGWAKKILNYIRSMLSIDDPYILANRYNITLQKAKMLIKNKEVILKQMDNNILYSNFTNSDVFWENILKHAIDNIKFKIDPSSSGDIYKIMRVPDTIHGGTGFLAKTINGVDELRRFNPFSDPVVFYSNNLKKIKIIKPVPKFELCGVGYGPFEVNQELELPEHICIFLMLKGVCVW
jgi:DNA primase small subunit